VYSPTEISVAISAKYQEQFGGFFISIGLKRIRGIRAGWGLDKGEERAKRGVEAGVTASLRVEMGLV
jgi:hypothetical protein